MSPASTAADGDPYRYGVYLRPDPATCWAVTAVTGQVRAQYGLVSAGAFPPHATLVGSQHVDRPAREVVEAVGRALDGVAAVPVHHGGVRPLGTGWVYDVHHEQDGTGVNAPLLELAATVDAAVRPLATRAPAPAVDEFDPARFHAHLSLASHDLADRPDLVDEVGEYIRGLPVTVPAGFAGDAVALYRTRSDDWTGRWWTTLTWTHVRTWRLRAPGAPGPAR